MEAGNQKPNGKRASLRHCANGHQFNKTSDCPTCPICEEERRPNKGLLAALNAPARRALENKRVKTVVDLSNCTEQEILALHGIGKSAMSTIRAALLKAGLKSKD